ncbi:GNAT family N-acetyltransferase [Kroppenstedtia pulmonis]|uniref:GNAT family N-acetyltransferase n=1 Tax=Kroppenstedtia pulmonis TaxID=1380685 RepID=A0A7D3XQ60_9BACL|nr:GNAT family protein [Kroppenstedtia pulmonis]QKG84487.1 GNAT family N-acetyltransferase [Kroppenstedtia pulmonis]
MEGHLVKVVPLEEEDAKIMSQLMSSTMISAFGRGRQDFFTEEQIRENLKYGGVNFVGIKTHSGKKVGYISWRTISYEGNYEVGGLVGEPQLWDTGCGGEAAGLVMDYLFQIKNAHRVQMVTGVYNRRSLGMALKSKLVMEGILRDYYFLDGEYHDAVLWSVLRDEYYKIDEYGPNVEVIPKEEKEAARKMFKEYLKENWNSEIFSKLNR